MSQVNLTVADYKQLGLIHNPFLLDRTFGQRSAADGLEIRSESLRLLSLVESQLENESVKPILVSKGEVSSGVTRGAESDFEYILANDTSLNVFHAFVQLAMFKNGRIASTLMAVGERVVYSGFAQNIADYCSKVAFADVDTELSAYSLICEEDFSTQLELFDQDNLERMEAWFGDLNVDERKHEFDKTADERQFLVATEVDMEDADRDDEVGDLSVALGVEQELDEVDIEAVAAEDHEELVCALMSDYIVSYIREHLSTVLSRSVATFRDRGLMAAAQEMGVTRAPRKTLTALCEFAACRRRRGVLLYDNFEQWNLIEADLRSKIVLSMTEIKLAVAPYAMMVTLLERGEVAELEESFGGGLRLDWDFEGFARLEELDTYVDKVMIDRWLAGAAPVGSEPLRVADCEVLGKIMSDSGDSILLFAAKAAAAIDDAAGRGVDALDEVALAASRQITEVDED